MTMTFKKIYGLRYSVILSHYTFKAIEAASQPASLSVELCGPDRPRKSEANKCFLKRKIVLTFFHERFEGKALSIILNGYA